MPPILSEILYIHVRPGFQLTSPAFAKLRHIATSNGGVTEQYYGMEKWKEDRLVWIIQWPSNVPSEFQSDNFWKELKELDIGNSPSSWLNPFEDDKLPRPALTAPLTEFANLYLKTSEKSDSTRLSLHKTFTDCYDAPQGGFVGGHWSTSLNDDRMNWYYLGWETKHHHTAYSKTPLFALEINNLGPFTEDGYAIWVELTQERS